MFTNSYQLLKMFKNAGFIAPSGVGAFLFTFFLLFGHTHINCSRKSVSSIGQFSSLKKRIQSLSKISLILHQKKFLVLDSSSHNTVDERPKPLPLSIRNKRAHNHTRKYFQSWRIEPRHLTTIPNFTQIQRTKKTGEDKSIAGRKILKSSPIIDHHFMQDGRARPWQTNASTTYTITKRRTTSATVSFTFLHHTLLLKRRVCFLNRKVFPCMLAVLSTSNSKRSPLSRTLSIFSIMTFRT